MPVVTQHSFCTNCSMLAAWKGFACSQTKPGRSALTPLLQQPAQQQYPAALQSQQYCGCTCSVQRGALLLLCIWLSNEQHLPSCRLQCNVDLS
jgi:hypothetical protein